jgi:threonylcarbamoyladenosine tRNA methylthiotransferase MtaB
MAGFHIEHFGCRAARADGEAIAGKLRALAEREPFAADVVIVNACSVTAEADRAARAFIRREHRRNPAAKIVVTGCYAQRAPDELANMAGVAAVVGNSHKALVPEIIRNLVHEQAKPAARPPAFVPVESLLTPSLQQAAIFHPTDQERSAGAPVYHPGKLKAGLPGAPVWVDDRFAHSFIEDTQLANAVLANGAQTRPNLKIQEGCGNRCTFCVIPFTRGPSKSLPRTAILSEVRRFVEAGGKELVLSGINLGRWGREMSGAERHNLPHLVREILEQTALPRLRLSSIEPMDWDDELISLMREFGGSQQEIPRCPGPQEAALSSWDAGADPRTRDEGRLARHAHLPLQSGSDTVLRRMHRRYRPWHYADKVSALVRAAGPHLTIGADVMVGFPGETDREFEETVAFIRALPFGYLHLFPFSPRPGTRAWSLYSASPVPQTVVDARMAALRILAGEKMRAHRSSLVGCELPAITLHTPPELAVQGRTAALTDNFLPVQLDTRMPPNELVQVRVNALDIDGSVLGSGKPRPRLQHWSVPYKRQIRTSAASTKRRP